MTDMLIKVLRQLDKQERARFFLKYVRLFGLTAELVRRKNNTGYVYKTPRLMRLAAARKARA